MRRRINCWISKYKNVKFFQEIDQNFESTDLSVFYFNFNSFIILSIKHMLLVPDS